MPAIPAGDLTKLRTTPHKSRLYMVIQAPARYDADAGTFDASDFVWYGTVKTAPSTDPVVSLEVTADAGASGVTILDGMTVVISPSGHGFRDRAIVQAHGDQTIAGGGADDTLYVAVSSHLSDVQVGDYVAVLDEFRFRSRFPKITESGGDLTWYKDFGRFRDSIGAGSDAYTWAQLGGGNDSNARYASMPPVPIMGPHVVKFIDPSVGSVTVDFDWSNSYSPTSGVSVNAWSSEGETDHVGGTWTDNVQNPGAKTYTNISGMRGFRVELELSTDQADPIVEFRRGVRYVFTLRRPGDEQAGDPDDAVPITDFSLDRATGSFETGGWTASVTVYDTYASEHLISPGALAIIFADDWYGSTKESIGPDDGTLADRENILLVGYIADGSISRDSETGETSFDIVSVTELLKNRENYPVPVELATSADEWYKLPSLTVDRAAHHYVTWHTNLKLITDVYQSGDTHTLKAQDFIAGDGYSTIDTFFWDRIFARFLCDRFGRIAWDIDQQMLTAGSGTTLFTMTTQDWVDAVDVEEVTETPVSIVDLGGLSYSGGLVTPYMSHAPGDVSGYVGTPEQMSSLAVSSQAELNTLAGRLYAYRNNRFPRITVPMAGNWRVFDIWPQEYVVIDTDVLRHDFSSDKAIVREVEFSYDAEVGALFTTISLELETDGPAGTTVEIPEEPPTPPTPPIPPPPPDPPGPGDGAIDTGRRIIATEAGVAVTDDIGASEPYWYLVNDGVITNSLYCWKVFRDPWHWWTTGGDEKTLWAIFGYEGWDPSHHPHAPRYLYKHENFPYGTWSLVYDATSVGLNAVEFITDATGTIEVEDRLYLCVCSDGPLYLVRSDDGGSSFVTQGQINTASGGIYELDHYPDRVARLANAHHSGGQVLYAHYGRSWPSSPPSFVYRSQDSGVTWVRLTNTNYSGGPDVQHVGLTCPYHSTDWNDADLILFVYHGYNTAMMVQRSEDFGASWSSISPIPGSSDYRVCALSPYTANRQIFTILFDSGQNWRKSRIYYTNDGGATWTLFWQASTAYRVSPCFLVSYNTDGSIQSVLLHSRDDNEIILVDSSGTKHDKTGNWQSVVGSITYVASIDRDTMGAA